MIFTQRCLTLSSHLIPFFFLCMFHPPTQYQYIVFTDRCYSDTLHLADLKLLSNRRQQACVNFATNCLASGTLNSLFRVPIVYYHGYNNYLPSGPQSYHASTGKCKRFNGFVTVKFQNVCRDRPL